jgi:hypothetical protein
LAQENGFSRGYSLSLVRLVHGSWYVTPHIKIREREVNILQFGSGFSPVYLLTFVRPVNSAETFAPAREECNKYDLTAAPHF